MAATLLYQREVPIHVIQEVLGHSRAFPTDTYIRKQGLKTVDREHLAVLPGGKADQIRIRTRIRTTQKREPVGSR